jgi:hypothetical protein
MGIIADISKNIAQSNRAKDFGIGVLGAVIGAFTTKFIFDKTDDSEEYDD